MEGPQARDGSRLIQSGHKEFVGQSDHSKYISGGHALYTFSFAFSPSLQGFSFLPALNAYSGHQLMHTNSTLKANTSRSLSTVAQPAKTAVATTKL